MQASCQVDVFGVEEDTLVEQARGAKGFHPQEHEAAGNEWHIHHLVVAAKMHFVIVIKPPLNAFKWVKQPASQQRHGRRKETANGLQPSVGKENLRRYQPDLAIVLHEGHQLSHHIR